MLIYKFINIPIQVRRKIVRKTTNVISRIANKKDTF